MKTVCTWLLLLLAVLVPATATIMASAFCPPISETKQAQMRTQAHPLKAQAKHLVAALASSAHGARSPATKQVGSHQPGLSTVAGAAVDAHAVDCDDCSACSHCSTCGPVNTMVVARNGMFQPRQATDGLLPELRQPHAEFLSGGQDRPPRQA